MHARLTTDPPKKAEGQCLGLPYDTELVSINGVRVHFWVPANPFNGDPDLLRLARALAKIRRHRDVVAASYSIGAPDSYWAHENIGSALTA